MFIENAWYVAAESREVADDLLGRTICSDPVVLFRAEDGVPAALEDRCCHRHLPLSLGRRVGNVDGEQRVARALKVGHVPHALANDANHW